MALWTSVDEEAGKPKNLISTEKLDTYGISLAEATTPANISKGINTPGWVKYTTYDDAQGETRHKVEVLVAARSMANDGDDDDVAVDPVITIATQPVSVTAAAEDEVSFSVEASINNGGTLTYVWQFLEPEGTWEDSTSTNPGWATGQLTDTITLTADVARDGYQFRCVVSSTGAANVTSDEVTLTVA